jgi:hypothetical protein
MTSILGKIFGTRKSPPPLSPGPGEVAFEKVMSESRALRAKLRAASQSTDAARAIMADVWEQSRNTPFIVTVFEAVEEAKSGAIYSDSSQQRISDRRR